MSELTIIGAVTKDVGITRQSTAVVVVGAQPNTVFQISISETKELEIESTQQTQVEITQAPPNEIDASINVCIGALAEDYVDISARDPSNEFLVYAGKSETPEDTASPTWQIYRLDISTDEILYADGNLNFDNVWDDYLALTYLPLP